MDHNTEHHIIGYKTLVKVLFSLLILTSITVWVSTINLGVINTTVAMIIASTKATLVLLFFMHLKFDKKIFRYLVGLVIAIFIAIMVLTFFDYFNR